MKGNEMFAALVTRANMSSISEAMWLNSAGIGDIEDQWEKFKAVFIEMFGISWEEAEKLAEEFL